MREKYQHGRGPAAQPSSRRPSAHPRPAHPPFAAARTPHGYPDRLWAPCKATPGQIAPLAGLCPLRPCPGPAGRGQGPPGRNPTGGLRLRGWNRCCSRGPVSACCTDKSVENAAPSRTGYNLPRPGGKLTALVVPAPRSRRSADAVPPSPGSPPCTTPPGPRGVRIRPAGPIKTAVVAIRRYCPGRAAQPPDLPPIPLLEPGGTRPGTPRTQPDPAGCVSAGGIDAAAGSPGPVIEIRHAPACTGTG